VVVGCALSLPLGWLLSYAATLPFFLGLFFFMLFGLVIGAAMHRAASPGRPHGSIALTIGTTIVVLGCWGFALFQESRDFPVDMANLAAARTRDIGDRTIETFRADFSRDVRRHLRDRYPPGGTFGYVRWALTDGALRRGDIDGLKSTLRARQTKWSWAIRAVLSIALLAFGVGSQTFPLRLSADAASTRAPKGESMTSATPPASSE
jgi:hypothetical protein